MSQKTLFIIISICFLFIAFIGLIAYEVATDPINEAYKDSVEYPLKAVDVNDNSDYMLVKWHHSPLEKYEVITDTQMIKENISNFSVDNIGTIYGTTSDGIIWLLRDGKQIDMVPFDNTYTRKIEYGTLQFQQINKFQYLLLTGYEIIEQGENYSILWDKQSENPYYSCFIHGENLESLDTVYWIDSTSHIDELPRPQKNHGDIIEFTAPFSTYAGDETAHWFFCLSDYKLSRRHLNVRAIRENIIVCTETNYAGPKIIVCDTFDKSDYYREITGDFSEKAHRLFLLNAEFTADGKLRAEYIGSDEQVHNDIFLLD